MLCGMNGEPNDWYECVAKDDVGFRNRRAEIRRLIMAHLQQQNCHPLLRPPYVKP